MDKRADVRYDFVRVAYIANDRGGLVAEKHRHIVQATEDQLLALLAGTSPGLREVYLEAHRLICSVLPDVRYETDTADGVTSYGVRQYGYDGWGMAALSAHGKWVSLHFFRGTDLDDPSGILEGSGKRLRHVKLRSTEQLKERTAGLARLLVQAAARNAGA